MALCLQARTPGCHSRIRLFCSGSGGKIAPGTSGQDKGQSARSKLFRLSNLHNNMICLRRRCDRSRLRISIARVKNRSKESLKKVLK
jgi:hypothetical protein